MRQTGTEFPPTPWSLILRIQQGTEEERSRALEIVCESYWQPLYVYARMAGRSPEDAEDLTQEFFGRLEASGLWARAEQVKGRLRSLLIGAFKRVAIDLHRRHTAVKRGGGVPHVRFDRELGEQTFDLEKDAGIAPDKAYDHAWALAVFFRALAELKDAYAVAGKARLFENLEPLLMKTGAETQREVAQRLGTSGEAIRTSLHNLRVRFRGQFRQLVKATLTNDENVEEEARYLLTVIRERGGL